MPRLQRKPSVKPDDFVEIPYGRFGVFEIGDGDVGYTIFEPGWRWSESVKPVARTDYCEFHHIGYTISGRLHVRHRDGAEMDILPGDFFEIPPHHDGWVVGDEPWISIDWGPGMNFARAPGENFQRVVATLLFTDIVSSTGIARRVGDGAWRDLLVRHNRLVRTQLERYRGRELDDTGDGFLAVFESAERAVRAALAITNTVRQMGLEVRAGIHSGEVELDGEKVRGLSVHVASRLVGLAGPSEVLVSWTTRDLLAGTTLDFKHRGTHELKGLPEARPVYAVSEAAEITN